MQAVLADLESKEARQRVVEAMPTGTVLLSPDQVSTHGALIEHLKGLTVAGQGLTAENLTALMTMYGDRALTPQAVASGVIQKDLEEAARQQEKEARTALLRTEEAKAQQRQQQKQAQHVAEQAKEKAVATESILSSLQGQSVIGNYNKQH